MASLHAEAKNPDRKRIMVRSPHDSSKVATITLGYMPDQQAADLLTLTRDLEASRCAGTLPADTQDRLDRVDDKLYARFVRVGLAPPRQPINAPRTVRGLCELFERHYDMKPQSLVTIRQTCGSLKSFFGEHCSLHLVTHLRALDWKKQMRVDGYSVSTINKRIKTARQLFEFGRNCELCKVNPFANVPAGGCSNQERAVFVDADVVRRVITACPSVELRTVIALCRFGGLRTPSEMIQLAWDDIDWAGERMLVHSPKTGGTGKDRRTVPIFSELLPYLRDAFERAKPGATWVCPQTASGRRNHRTQFERLLVSCGVEPWPRLFNNMRASRQTELTKAFPLHVVCRWLGNTEAIAYEHYLQVTEQDFKQAAKSGATKVPMAAVSEAAKPDPGV